MKDGNRLYGPKDAPVFVLVTASSSTCSSSTYSSSTGPSEDILVRISDAFKFQYGGLNLSNVKEYEFQAFSKTMGKIVSSKIVFIISIKYVILGSVHLACQIHSID